MTKTGKCESCGQVAVLMTVILKDSLPFRVCGACANLAGPRA